MDRNFPRLLDTLRLIPRQRWATCAEVHAGLEAAGHQVTRRTVQRDLEALASRYAIETDRRDRTFAWRWREGAHAPVMPSMDLHQALALLFMDRQLAALLPQRLQDALAPWTREAERVAQAHGNARATRWPAKVAIQPLGPPLQPARIDPGTWRDVLEALYLERQITGEYRRAYARLHTPVALHPLGLVDTGLVAYLVARFDGHEDVRLLALHRLRRVKLLDMAAQAPIGFDLTGYLQHQGLGFGPMPRRHITLLMAQEAAHHLHDTPLSNDQQIQPCSDRPGWVRVQATVADSPRLQWWINGFGDQAERVSPGNDTREDATLPTPLPQDPI